MWISVFLLITVSSVNLAGVKAKHIGTPVEVEDRSLYEKYVEVDKSIKKLVGYAVKTVLPFVMEANEHLNLSSSCKRDVFQLIADVKKLKMPALKLLDATGKLHSGFLEGTVFMLGDYDECMNTVVQQKDGNVAFKGQYCMVHVRPVLPKKKKGLTVHSGLEELVEYTKNTSDFMRFITSVAQAFYDNPSKLGLCVPSGCSFQDVNLMLRYLGEKSSINATARYCDQQDNFPFSAGTTIAIFFFSLFGLLFLAGSFLDYYCKKKEIAPKSGSSRFLLCFSVLRNFPKVISTKISDQSLTSVFGIRTLSLFYIVLMHQQFCLGMIQIQGHVFHHIDLFPYFFPQIGLNGFLSTEGFFFIGGLVNAYSRMKAHETGKHKIGFVQMIVHRLWRIYPPYMFSILTCYLFARTRGPLATQVRQLFSDNCDKYWWQNLLFINNMFPQTETCMVHSWYIAADMQLFLISLFTIPVFLRSAKRGIILHLAILTAGLAGTALWAWHKDIMPALIFYRLNVEEISKVWHAYTTVTPHIAPYFTGLITGYVLCKWKEFKIPKIYQCIGWPASAACLISMLFMTREWNSGKDFTLVESTLYFAFCRFLYVLPLAWLVVCCARGYGGIFNYILSLKIWVPISRISYMMFLISILLQINYFGHSRMSVDNDNMTLIWRYVGDLTLSGLMGLAMVVVVESPFISMEKLVFGRKSTFEKENCEKNVEEPAENFNVPNVAKEMETEKNHANGIITMQLRQ